ncbi:hypothetical protein C5F52_28445 [Limnohabitans sp. TS-CS-82]|jgi:hypothetical protein|uniref:AAA family ATPase n=1 Tax=Limnohabitans sp. TS-CS-82 TaxID=2094193 RepID=UPI000CF2BCB8|nr:AAA family ATPase [Limnohabitans sp. TS-CS-82]PQA79816.1 hypothetical protein C5F52_28445 [Limnohabitans sp. TS-CS-82]
MMQKTTPTGLMDSFSQLTKHLDTKDASTLNSNATITPPLEWLGMPIDLRETRRVAQKNVDYVLSPIIPAGRATLVTGVGASSKSMLLKQMAIAVAIGRDFLGLSVPTPGKAVLILAEDTSEDAHRSLDAIFQGMNLTDDEITLAQKRLHVFAAAGMDCVIVNENDASERLEKLLAFVSSLGDVRLIGLDPAIALSRGRELDEMAQRDLANAVERIAITSRAAVLVISHAAKSIQSRQEITSHSSRGSGAITDAFRLEILMRVMTEREARDFRIPEEFRFRYVRMQVTKANSLSYEEMQPRWIERGSGGVLTLANLAPPVPTAWVRKRRGLELFFNTDTCTGEVCPTTLSKAEWKKRAASAALLTGVSTSAKDMSATRLFAAIQDCNWIYEAEGKWTVTAEGLNELLD